MSDDVPRVIQFRYYYDAAGFPPPIILMMLSSHDAAHAVDVHHYYATPTLADADAIIITMPPLLRYRRYARLATPPDTNAAIMTLLSPLRRHA